MSDQKLVSFENEFFETQDQLNDENPDVIAKITIDGYPEDENESGRVVCEIYLTKHDDTVIAWREREYAGNIRELITESKNQLTEYAAEKKPASQEATPPEYMKSDMFRLTQNDESPSAAMVCYDMELNGKFSVKDLANKILADIMPGEIIEISVYNQMNELLATYTGNKTAERVDIQKNITTRTENMAVFHGTMQQTRRKSEWRLVVSQ